MTFDAHAHLQDPLDHEAAYGFFSQVRAAGIQGMVLAGVSPAGWGEQLAVARQRDDVWVTVGIHPWHCAQVELDLLPQVLERMASLVRGEAKVVGLGEMGLDAIRASEAPQEKVFRAQLALARELEVPAVLHVVRSHESVLRIVERDGLGSAGGMVHGFIGSEQLAQRYLQKGLHISFGGGLLQSSKTQKALCAIPSSMWLVESDALLGERKSEGKEDKGPSFLLEVLEKAAALRGISHRRASQQTQENARRLFGIPHSGAGSGNAL